MRTGRRIRVLSLGAGVQSTTLALMAAEGQIAPPDCAIFADTQWEPDEVYRHLDRLETLLPFPVYRVTAGDIRDTIGADSFEPIPWRTAEGGLGRRECTNWYKLQPIRKKVKELLGTDRPRPRSCEMWLGISTNEAHRMKPSRVRYIQNRWPLIELSMSRANCLRWLEQRGITAPRSACCGCPYLNNEDWRRLRRLPEWDATVAISHKLAARGYFMHHSLKPLDEADIGYDDRQFDMFANECEGVCGL